MTIRELLRVVPENDTIEIKPDGRRTYFLGREKGVPDSLEAGEITEISVVLDEEKGFILSVRIADIKEWDFLYDKFGVADDVVSSIFNDGYNQLIKEGIESVRKEIDSLDDSAITTEQVKKEVEKIEALLLMLKREME